jgi:tryptophan synthase alpha chain
VSARIRGTWKRLQESGQKALIPFVTAGYPNRATTLLAVRTAADVGADLIELGVPFSDPLADGPAIQHSSEIALKRGTGLGDILRIVEAARRHTSIPLLLMGYYNPFLCYGTRAFARDAAAAGVDGLIIPDLPFEEGEEFKLQAEQAGLSMVYLIAPTTTNRRVREAGRHSTDFCYCVALTGVTGARTNIETRTEDYLDRVRRLIKKPMVVGFGVSSPAHVKRLRAHADGVVVGSALVPVLEQAAKSKNGGRILARALTPLVQAAHGNR